MPSCFYAIVQYSRLTRDPESVEETLDQFAAVNGGTITTNTLGKAVCGHTVRFPSPEQRDRYSAAVQTEFPDMIINRVQRT